MAQILQDGSAKLSGSWVKSDPIYGPNPDDPDGEQIITGYTGVVSSFVSAYAIAGTDAEKTISFSSSVTSGQVDDLSFTVIISEI